MAVDKDLEDLVSFLKSPSPSLKKGAVEIVQGLSGTDEGVQRLATSAGGLLPPLLQLLLEAKEVAKPAAEALVNLSQDAAVADHLVQAGAVERAVELVGKPGTKTDKLMVMLLVNLSNVDKGAARLLQDDGLSVAKLVRLFARFSSSERGGEDEFEHVANILVNVTRLQSGRKVVLDMSRGILRQILPQIDSRSVIRRQGVAGTVRNCCFDAETQLPSLLLASEFLWPALLLPLAGKRVYSDADTAKMPLELATPLSQDREPETDPKVRVAACEAIYLLVLQEGGRRAFWAINGPRILELSYEDEEDPQVMEAFERVGALLVGGSGTEEEEPQSRSETQALIIPLQSHSQSITCILRLRHRYRSVAVCILLLRGCSWVSLHSIMKRAVLLLFLVLPLVAVFGDSDADEWGLEGEANRELVLFNDRNFEHDTQAATGQTTGAWLVLFVDRRCEKCTLAEKAISEAATEQQPIPALVNVLESPKIRKRFSMTQMPQLRLFRDRRMFVYKGDWNAASISAFIQTGWKETEAQEVPPEASAISEYLDGLNITFHSIVEYLGSKPGLLVAIGGFMATAAYVMTLRILGLTPKTKRAATRPRVRPVKKRAD